MLRLTPQQLKALGTIPSDVVEMNSIDVMVSPQYTDRIRVTIWGLDGDRIIIEIDQNGKLYGRLRHLWKVSR